jgi:hypothetical protein
VTVPPDLFIGLVTHSRSRFADAAQESGLGPVVTRCLEAAGLSVRWEVSDDDSWSPELLVIDRAAVARAIDAEIASEARWRAHIAGRPLTWRERAILRVRRLVRRGRLLPVFRRTLNPGDRGFQVVRRLANIELSHMRVMRDAVESQADWVLILEDDAWTQDPSAFASDLQTFMDSRNAERTPVMLSLSESFTPSELGIQHLLTPVAPDTTTSTTANPWQLWMSDLPVTNTVCATLYRGTFLREVVQVLDTIPLSPVIPIDFKLNEALMRMAPSGVTGDCWIASPAPVAQRSGVPTVRA